MNILLYLKDQGCPWDNKTCWAAACEGHANVLQWLLNNGCPEPMENDDYTHYISYDNEIIYHHHDYIKMKNEILGYGNEN